MKLISFTEARAGLESLLDAVTNDADVAIITRRGAQPAVVMSMDHYSRLLETLHLVKSPANASHLQESIEQYHAGQVASKNPHEPRLQR